MVFTACDGKEFETERKMKKYEYKLKYTFSNQSGEELAKSPGDIAGEPFDIMDLKDCTVIVPDHTNQIQVDCLTNCRMFVGACEESFFLRDCKNCVVYVCCKQLRTRGCENCTIYLYCKTDPIIETSSGMKFGCFHGGYPEQEQHFRDANLDPEVNKWSKVFDFNDEGKTGEHWTILPDSEYGDPWFPLGSMEAPLVARTQGVCATAGDSEMQSFSFNTSQAEAEAAVAATDKVAPPAPPPSDNNAPPPPAAAAAEVRSEEGEGVSAASTPADATTEARSALIVVTSGATYSGMDTGIWVEELAHPYYMLLSAGWKVTIASPSGGPVPIDSGSMRGDFFTIFAQQFMQDPEAVGALTHSKLLADCEPSLVDDFDVVFLVGGHGCCADFVDNPVLKSCLEKMYAAEGKVVSSVCHGAIALAQCVKSDGTPLVQGLKCTAFSNSEETAVGLADKVPFLIESKFKELGSLYECGEDWHGHSVIDGCLVTGQNPQSSDLVTKAVLSLFA
mmetsp:Transcript_12092/g.15937  ORF Transcript_12092/g.15937 Transcript_12092/m.15937 type:complete len:505 (-) Transcript_12092:443-1957(-)|eukprot:CAMPEP_0185779388 /NCGR_PEP_ID=MMETSP1174-20130828/95670_1 /TAXON_ID=35687 /ORGANISM="Dictyocha speculum, Strain CCMP1381" /LENGTH=504 /DNA_ID=CAMNT_0028468521 /DNA_START=52 /DNA_END=1566 /DNA_ORIENTATION=+